MYCTFGDKKSSFRRWSIFFCFYGLAPKGIPLYTYRGRNKRESQEAFFLQESRRKRMASFFVAFAAHALSSFFLRRGILSHGTARRRGFLVRDAFFFPALLRIGCVKKKQFVSFSCFSHHYSNFKKAHPKNFSAEIFLARKTGCQIYFCVCASACPWYTK